MKTVKSFTMAEVLITLGIVGIVAAMTLPALVGNHRRKVLESQFKLDRKFTSNGITCTPVYMLKDGSSICTYVYSSRISITVDINGPMNKPNAFGHDIFMFLVNNQDALQGQKPSEGAPDPNSEYYETNKNPCTVKSNQAGNGIGCSYYALMNECPDGKGKSYWECLPK